MRARVKRALAGLALYSVSAATVAADVAQVEPLSDEQWQRIGQRVALLDTIAYLPSLLPVIMENRDALELSAPQVAAFREWRRWHYGRMVELMNDIIERRIALSRAALDRGVSAEEILRQQEQIFVRQRELIGIRLSCRELITGTFTKAQWEHLAFVLEDYPQYAGLLQ